MFSRGINYMKIDRHVKILLSFLCIGIWLLAGSSAALGAEADEPAGLTQKRESGPPVLAPTSPIAASKEPIISSNARAGQPAAESATEPPERYVTIDFENVDINLFIKYISELTGKNFIIDKAVRGNVRPTRFLNLFSRSRVLPLFRQAPSSRSCPLPMPGPKALKRGSKRIQGRFQIKSSPS
jgi:hypothetical protein